MGWPACIFIPFLSIICDYCMLMKATFRGMERFDQEIMCTEWHGMEHVYMDFIMRMFNLVMNMSRICDAFLFFDLWSWRRVSE